MGQALEDPVDVLPDPSVDPEALIEEVRRQTRRRRCRNLAFGIAVILAGVSLAVVLHGSKPPTHGNSLTKGRAGTAKKYLASSYIRQPVSLAPAPNGGVYIADVGRQQILERLPNGSVRVLAGTGSVGLTGDGGSAVRANLDSPGNVVVTPDGDLFFTQYGLVDLAHGPLTGSPTTVIREITPNGAIHTVAGLHPSCSASAGHLSSMPAVDLDGAGNLFIWWDHGLDVLANGCRNFGPYLRLTPTGSLVTTSLDTTTPRWVREFCGPPTIGSGFTAFACDSGAGHPKELLILREDGTTKAYPAFSVGALVSVAGKVVGAFNDSVVRVTGARLNTIVSGRQWIRLTPDSLSGAITNGLALDPEGNVFLLSDVYLRHAAGCEAIIGVVLKNEEPRALWRLKSRLCY